MLLWLQGRNEREKTLKEKTTVRNDDDANKCSYRTIYVHHQQGICKKEKNNYAENNAISCFYSAQANKNQSI